MDYLILALATWRVTSLLVNENGPWFIFAKLRAWLGIRYDPETLQSTADSVAAGAFLCLWCLSVWVGMAWLGFYAAWQWGAIWTALPFALSAAAVMIEQFVRGRP